MRARRPPAAADTALIACGRTRTIGVAAPITGAAASIGPQQRRWARFFVTRYNRSHRRTKFRDRRRRHAAARHRAGDPGRRAAVRRTRSILGVVGPAGSQEVQVSTAPLKSGGLGFVSGSATRTSLTTDGTRRGYFFRVVPNDDQQGPRVANYIRDDAASDTRVVDRGRAEHATARASRTRSSGSSRRRGVNVRRESVNEADTTDFSSLAARIPANTQVVYVPWQLAPKAQLFGQQLRAAGKTREAVRLGRALRSGQLQDPRLVRLVLPDRPDAARSSRRTGAGPAAARASCSASRATQATAGRRRGRSTRRAERHGDACRGPAQHRPAP